ncbi:MAG TPA: hypothetical protein DSN98_08515 [Thermoplasmata archaeon]|jgi:hypothetical protein|nr:MAG TPA: hypothetical protein DSN98_08515 [Thermoplasmata archaeon]
MSEEIKFIITPKGITIEAEGFTDGKCLTELDSFLKSMESIGVKSRQKDQKMKNEDMYVVTESSKTANHKY